MLILFLSLLILAAVSGPATGDTTAQLRFDLAAGHLEILVGAERHTFQLADEDLGSRLRAFREGLAQGVWEQAEAAALGRALLGDARAVLEPASSWEVSPVEVAPLGAIAPPWDPGKLLLDSVVIWYRAAGAPWPPSATESESTGEGVLLVAPYHAGFEPIEDNPDTLLLELRPELRTLDLVPRNDTTPTTIAGSLADHAYSLVWLRAQPSATQTLLPALSGGPSLLAWSRPGNERAGAASTATVLEITSTWTLGGKSMLADLWPRGETQVAEGMRVFARKLQDSATAATALADARRALTAEASPRAWAGWILVGAGEQSLRLKKASWLQKLFRR
jgi:hypothetical protein